MYGYIYNTLFQSVTQQCVYIYIYTYMCIYTDWNKLLYYCNTKRDDRHKSNVKLTADFVLALELAHVALNQSEQHREPNIHTYTHTYIHTYRHTDIHTYREKGEHFTFSQIG